MVPQEATKKNQVSWLPYFFVQKCTEINTIEKEPLLCLQFVNEEKEEEEEAKKKV